VITVDADRARAALDDLTRRAEVLRRELTTPHRVAIEADAGPWERSLELVRAALDGLRAAAKIALTLDPGPILTDLDRVASRVTALHAQIAGVATAAAGGGRGGRRTTTAGAAAPPPEGGGGGPSPPPPIPPAQPRLDLSAWDAGLLAAQAGLDRLRTAAHAIEITLDLRSFDNGVLAAHQSLERLRIEAGRTPAGPRAAPRGAAVPPILSRTRGGGALPLDLDRARATSALNLVMQQFGELRQRFAARLVLNIDLRPWRMALATVHADLAGLRLATNVNMRVNSRRAQEDINLVLTQLRLLQRNANITLTAQQGAGFPLPTGGGGGAGGGGGGGGGGKLGKAADILVGMGHGAGLPFAQNPAQMVGQIAVTLPLIPIRAAAELETGFAELRAITGATAEEMGQFQRRLMEMATQRGAPPIADLMEGAQVGARAGVFDRGGVEGLETFTRQIALVRRAITDIPTEELADRMMRIQHVFDLGTENTAGLGSALKALDSTTTATSRDILDISTRLSGTGRAIGLTLPQVLALSSVLTDVGLANEVAGSSFSQIFRKMATDSGNFAKQIGVDAETFATAYRTDPMKALELVINKFNEFKDTISGQEFLANLGLEGVRVTAALQQLAARFSEVQGLAQVASHETGTQETLTRTADIKTATVQAGFDQLGNTSKSLLSALGERLKESTNGFATVVSDVFAASARILRREPHLTPEVRASLEQAGAKPPALPATPPAPNAPGAPGVATGAGPAAPVTPLDAAANAINAAQEAHEWALAGVTEAGAAFAARQREAAAAAARSATARLAAQRAPTSPGLRVEAATARAAEQAALQAVVAADADRVASIRRVNQTEAAYQQAVAAATKIQQEQAAQIEEHLNRDRRVGTIHPILQVPQRAFAAAIAAAGAGQEIVQGAGRKVKGALDALPDKVPRAVEQRQVGVAQSGEEMRREIQRAILDRKSDAELEEAARNTARNTHDAVGFLADLKGILLSAARNVGAAAMGP
jgi:TP901 family phage tail tape measure protein